MTPDNEDNSVLFSWSAPFSLNISDTEPDILYYVIIIDGFSKTTMNTTDTHYLLPSDACLFSEFHVEIAAVNVVGVGEKYRSSPLTPMIPQGIYIVRQKCCVHSRL